MVEVISDEIGYFSGLSQTKLMEGGPYAFYIFSWPTQLGVVEASLCPSLTLAVLIIGFDCRCCYSLNMEVSCLILRSLCSHTYITSTSFYHRREFALSQTPGPGCGLLGYIIFGSLTMGA